MIIIPAALAAVAMVVVPAVVSLVAPIGMAYLQSRGMM